MDSGDEGFKIICLGTMGAIFIEIEKKMFLTLPCWEMMWSLGGREGSSLRRELNSNGVKPWRCDMISQLETGMGSDKNVMSGDS